MKIGDIAIIFGLAACVYILFALLLPPQRELNEKLARLEQIKTEKDAMEREREKLDLEASELERETPHRMIHVARETFRYCYPNEKVYQFPDKK